MTPHTADDSEIDKLYADGPGPVLGFPGITGNEGVCGGGNRHMWWCAARCLTGGVYSMVKSVY